MTDVIDTPWEITGADRQTIFGNTHSGANDPAAVVLFVHGFLGYKDYGMFPYLAHHTASHGYASLRFNLSHSGMTNHVETFERPDLFARDTWSKQIFDVMAVMSAANAGRIPGCPSGLPCILYGHSRGGVTVLLTTGRLCAAATSAETDPVGPVDPLFGRLAPPAAAVTVAAPSFTARLSPGQLEQIEQMGYAEVVSNRTGQTLRINRSWLQEQLDNPAAHDLPAHVVAITCPLTIVHGESDPTVPVRCAHDLLGWASPACSPRPVLVPGADHVFNAPNPMPIDATPSVQLQTLCRTVLEACAHAIS